MFSAPYICLFFLSLLVLMMSRDRFQNLYAPDCAVQNTATHPPKASEQLTGKFLRSCVSSNFGCP